MRARTLLFAALIALACNRESPTAPGLPIDPLDPAASAVLTGRTVDPNGTPVPNVVLRVSSGDRTVGRATSGDDGTFRFEGLHPGALSILLTANGGAEQGAGLVRLVSGVNTRDVLVSACKIPYGTVRNASTGHPIAGAKVTIFYLETLTDANGQYRLDFGCQYVPGSTIRMTAEHPDYQPSETLTRASFLCTCALDFLLTRRR
ncbi:MAG TPA: carboxypeptidase-like regulatory domain-containing protein [Thermoanaerobaculia bacterium]|nr:carboxypeptidase-like regulatory domain-containing protein [Thermoanaerobaculia bacterium]